MINHHNISILPITAEDLRADHGGTLIEQVAHLAFAAFREPPWHDDHSHSRLHFGLGVDLMRKNSLAFIAGVNNQVIGYSVGYELVKERDDSRDISLEAISGTRAMDAWLEQGRLFYWDTLCVAQEYRRLNIASRLALAAIDKLRAQGFAYYLARTDQNAVAMRGALSKLGFAELPVHDSAFPTRTYWLLRL